MQKYIHSIAPPKTLVDPVTVQKPAHVRLVPIYRARGQVGPLLRVAEDKDGRAGEGAVVDAVARVGKE